MLAEPAVQLSGDTEFDPDVVVVRQQQVGGAKLTRPPILIVEIRSPSTALIDLNRKKAACERFGVEAAAVTIGCLAFAGQLSLVGLADKADGTTSRPACRR